MPAPAVVRSKGPNGTHWFSNTPWWGDVGNSALVPNVIECDPTVPAIEAAVATATKAKVDAGMAILVKPGTIKGGATSAFVTNGTIIPSVMFDGKGAADWTKKLLIWPRDGYGSVKVNGQITFESATNIVWAGISSFDPNNSRRYTRDGYNINNCNKFGWGWCETGSIRVNANAGRTANGNELKEFGWPEKITREGDYAGLGVNNTATVNGLLLEGFFLPPCYHLITVPWKNNAPSDAHSDSWQIQNGPNVSNIVYRDGFSAASTNVAFQNGGYQNLRFDNVFIAGGKEGFAKSLWPFENNEATDGNMQALNGSGSVLATDCIIMGGVGSATFLEGTTNTKIAYDWTGATRNRVTVDKTLLNMTPAQVFAISPKFTPERQAQIFGATYTPPTDTTPPSTPVLNVPTIAGRDVQLSWVASTDNVAVQEYIVLRGTTSANAVEIARTTDTVYTDAGRPLSSTQLYLIKAVDTAGLESPVSNSRTAVIGAGVGDTVKPTVSILSPTVGSPVSGTVIVQVQAADNVAVTEVQLWSAGQKLPGTFEKTTGDIWEGRFDSTAFPDGTYPIEAHAFDAAPNEAISATVNVTISNFVRPPDPTEPPSVPVLTVEATGLTAALATWTESVAQNGGEVEYRFRLDGDIVETKITDLARDIEGLDPTRQHFVVIEAYETTSNLTSSSAAKDFNTWEFDEAGPTIALQSPGEGELSGTVQFRFDVTDAGSGVKAVDVYWGDVLVGIGGFISGSTYGLDINVNMLPAGMNSYRGKAVDNAGNESWSDARTVSLPVVAPPDSTPPTGGISDPVDGSVVVPPFSRVRLSASDPQSGISSVSLRSSTLGELVPASLVSPGIYEADFPVGALSYGDNEVFARIVNGVGLSFDTPAVTLVREAPVASPSGRGLIAGPWLDGSFKPNKSGRIVLRQRASFSNDLGYVTTAVTEVYVVNGKFIVDGVEGPFPFGFPPLDLGFEVDEYPDSGTPRLGLVKRFPDGTVDGQIVAYGDLVPLEVEGLPAGAYVPIGVTEALEARDQVVQIAAELDAQTITMTESPDGFFTTITIGE
ncbi:Ig-like domain-containing protein [Rathayibacter sp. ZW T2_19]|uniref:Ig-like domain-containing protein n=1 Tax=Rathayibacter rubneri TaxID=2950106 RepID=A0A9X2ISC9_9MICO|nr:Ig-like domain-containing protein [Rathayibacter rubneri]MCM6761383.1 Ig-like domain-containing protein [Rathayibacter rubneri]